MEKMIYNRGCGVKVDLTEMLANVSEALDLPCVIDENNGYFDFYFIKNGQKIGYFTTNEKGELHAYMCGILNAESIKKL